MSIRKLQGLLIKARGKRNRPAIAEAALDVDAGDPDFDEDFIRKIEVELTRPPVEGLKFRTLCATTGVPLVTALEALGYWPPLVPVETEIPALSPTDRYAGLSDLAALRELCENRRARVCHHDPSSGRVVIQL